MTTRQRNYRRIRPAKIGAAGKEKQEQRTPGLGLRAGSNDQWLLRGLGLWHCIDVARLVVGSLLRGPLQHHPLNDLVFRGLALVVGEAGKHHRKKARERYIGEVPIYCFLFTFSP